MVRATGRFVMNWSTTVQSSAGGESNRLWPAFSTVMRVTRLRPTVASGCSSSTVLPSRVPLNKRVGMELVGVSRNASPTSSSRLSRIASLPHRAARRITLRERDDADGVPVVADLEPTALIGRGRGFDFDRWVGLMSANREKLMFLDTGAERARPKPLPGSAATPGPSGSRWPISPLPQRR